ncbi:amino acid transporter [Mesobacillus campisalis]|uniref:Amino acid transporter n=1 Tax=Mesobacillus campisalis TaxID=1408103 RepID=A0A0M2SZY7_9BACI|nr:amino acid permease [Mesobacillus campisalis]KKK39743.1 amino acid transporter [Mesobacillus campisalis]
MEKTGQPISQQNQLNRAMKSRHLFMLSIGGVIGTGLFLNAGYTINQAGPGGALAGYLFGGLILYLVMVCLGELAVHMPVTGSFQTYASRYISPSAGFTLGWMYFIGSATTAGLEFTAAGILMQRWFPDISIWIWCALFIALLFGLNALTTRAFGEAEYWFAGIKVVAVIFFILIGVAAIFGIVPLEDRPAPEFANLAPSGLFPAGFVILFVTMMNVIFSYQGSELIGIAAGESENPDKDIPRAIRNVLFRIIIFYISSIIVLSAIFPATELGLLESPFVTLMDLAGIPYAPDIMNFVILTAILSVGNSCIYASTRLLWSMSNEGMAPRMFGALNKRKVPFSALVFTMLFSLLSLLTSFMAADTVFVLLMSIAGISVTISWIGIAFSQLMFRRKYLQGGGKLEDLKYKVPFYPLIPIVCIVFCISILLFLAFDPTQRLSLLIGIGFLIASYLFYYFRNKVKDKAVIKKEDLRL